MRRLLSLVFAVALGACGDDPREDARPVAPRDAASAAALDPEMEAARVLLRHAKSRIDGVMPPASWPELRDVRSVGDGVFVVDIDTTALPGGYPGQLVVEVSGAGGHSGRALR